MLVNNDGNATFDFLLNVSLAVAPPTSNATNQTIVNVNVDLSGVEDRISLWFILAIVALLYVLGLYSRMPILLLIAGTSSVGLAWVIWDNFKSDPIFGSIIPGMLLLSSIVIWIFSWDLSRGNVK